MNRLSAATVSSVRGEVTNYDRSGPATIVHLGVGAFARAHLGVYADDLLRAGHRATIAGVSLRDPATEARLAPQDGLYSVTEREPHSDFPPRVIGALTAMATGPDAALAALAGPEVTLVTLTVTEKGYEVPAGDLVAPHQGRSAPAVVARALHDRHRTGRAAPVVASLDNLSDNGAVLRAAVISVAERLDPATADWIAERVAFPGSVVDRMVPAATDADRAEVARRLGLADHAAVLAERHRSWVIEAVDGLPPLTEAGVEAVEDLEPYQRRKLWLLNGPHSATACAGLLVRAPTISAAASDPRVDRFVRALVEDVLTVFGDERSPVALSAEAFAEAALARFRNPALGHTCAQVGADGSRKLPQRLFPVVAARHRADLPNARPALVVAMWLAAVAGAPVGMATGGGEVLPPVEDPAAAVLRSTPVDRLAQVALADPVDAGTLDAGFVDEVAEQLERVRRDGATALGVPP